MAEMTEKQIRAEMDALRPVAEEAEKRHGSTGEDLDAYWNVMCGDVLLAENNLRENRNQWEIASLAREFIRYGKILEGFDHMLDSIYSAVERMADCVYEHPRLKKKLLELESLVLLRIESLHDRDLSVTEDIDREINRLGFNIEYADNGRLDLIVDDGHLKHDPVEWTARWEEVVDEADRIVDRKLAGHPRGMGFCFAYWHERKIALGKFGVDWRSPAEMNPGVMFD